MKKKVENETKDKRFKRIATRRVSEILKKLRILGNCSNTAVYSYNENEVNQMFKAIDIEIKHINALFKKSKGREFSLEK